MLQFTNLIDGLVESNVHSINDVDAVGLGVDDVLLHEAAEARQIGGDRGDAHHGTLSRGVAPKNIIQDPTCKTFKKQHKVSMTNSASERLRDCPIESCGTTKKSLTLYKEYGFTLCLSSSNQIFLNFLKLRPHFSLLLSAATKVWH